MDKPHKLQIIITPAQWERLKEMATKDKRSVTNYLTMHLERTLDEAWEKLVASLPPRY